MARSVLVAVAVAAAAGAAALRATPVGPCDCEPPCDCGPTRPGGSLNRPDGDVAGAARMLQGIPVNDPASEVPLQGIPLDDPASQEMFRDVQKNAMAQNLDREVAAIRALKLKASARKNASTPEVPTGPVTWDAVTTLRQHLQVMSKGLEDQLASMESTKIGPEMAAISVQLRQTLTKAASMKDPSEAMRCLREADAGINALTRDLLGRRQQLIAQDLVRRMRGMATDLQGRVDSLTHEVSEGEARHSQMMKDFDAEEKGQASQANILHLLQLHQRAMGRDCPFCVAQCLDKCHDQGKSYATCLGSCADAGK